jgi:hypothetical protein
MTTETKHTKEPCECPGTDGGEYVICYKDKIRSGKRRTIAHVYGEANARRIVACVNACAGFSTADLESATTDKRHRHEIIADLVAANKQRDELARLCEKALTRSAIVHPGFADEIRAALAKVQP